MNFTTLAEIDFARVICRALSFQIGHSDIILAQGLVTIKLNEFIIILKQKNREKCELKIKYKLVGELDTIFIYTVWFRVYKLWSEKCYIAYYASCILDSLCYTPSRNFRNGAALRANRRYR